MPTSLVYLYQLQGASYSSLIAQPCEIAVVDPDDSALTARQIDNLEQRGKTLFSYLSIGEAENYRSYWTDNNWNTRRPTYVMSENPDWPGNYLVQFWNTSWQTIIINRAKELAQLGYGGVYLDIVDAYERDEAIASYRGTSTIRQEMIDFVTRISAATKAINPNFKIIPQNAVGLFGTTDDDSSHANTAYLNVIDGLGKEDTWTNDDEGVDWTQGDLEFIQLAQNAGKFVLAIDYPTIDSLQTSFLQNAANKGFLPYVSDRSLDGTIDDTNAATRSLVSLLAIDKVRAAPSSSVTVGTANGESINANNSNNLIYADAGNDTVSGNGGHDFMRGGNGNDVMDGGDGHDTIFGGGGLDTIYGKQGNDTIYGMADADSLIGNYGDDYIHGGLGNDTLDGSQGADTLEGGGGNDLLRGGLGNDVFLYQGAAFGSDTISSFEGEGPGNGDRISFTSSVFANVAAVLAATTYSGTTATITLSTSNIITVQDVTQHFTSSDIEVI